MGGRETEVLAGGGDMGALLRTVDWAATPVGPIESWPQSLRTAVSIVLESKFAMMVAWGRDFTQFYNDPFRPILGATKHPALGKSTRDTFAEAWHIVGPLFDRVMQGDAVGFEDMLVPLDRNGYLEECYFVYSYSPIRDESGGVGGLLVTVAETTARVVAERRLRTLRDLAARAAAADDETDGWARAQAVLAGNPTDIPFALLYRLADDGESAELVCPAPSELAPGTVALGGSAPTPWPLADAAAAGGIVRVTDVRARFGDRPGPAWPEPVAEAVVLPIARPGRSRPYGFLVAGVNPRRALDDDYRDFFVLVAEQISTTIANIRTLEQEKARSRTLAELDRAKTVFFSNISHEFRTPLTLMIGPLTDVLSGTHGELDDGQRDYLELIHRNAVRLEKLVNALLEFSRIEAGRMRASYEPTDLATLTREVASAFESVIERGGVRLGIDCPPTSQPAWVDRGMWETIVSNLLSNAFKFTFEGSVGVELTEDDDGVLLTVRDTGVGIPEHELPKLFSRFHRVEGTRSRSQEGSGIGLALVRDLVRLHGGAVTVTSRLGAGTTFFVRLPHGCAHLPAEHVRAAKDPAKVSEPTASFVDEAMRWLPDAEDDAAAIAAVPASSQGTSAAARVLVVDDNADMRGYLRRILEQRWAVDVAVDGEAAWQRIRAHPPDLVLTDIMMPRLDGFGLLSRLRGDPATRSIPVVMLSARAGEELRAEGIEAGADDYLVKPFSTRELLARVATHLQLAALRRTIESERENERALRAEAQAATRAKDEFLALLGHELRNPLAPIVSALHLMRLRGDESREQHVLERQVGHLTRLVDDLLDVSRIARGNIELRRQIVELGTIVDTAVEMSSPLVEQRGHSLEIRVPRTGLAVDVDPGRMAQVVGNLLTNAAKYSDIGNGILVEAEREGEWIRLRVRDWGAGIAADMIDRIFDLFVQQPQTLDRASGGIGLGLTLVRSLVELHGGHVQARSEGLGHGSEFTVALRAVPHDALAGSNPQAVAPSSAVDSGELRVLVVDDNEDAATMLAATLRACGCSVAVAHDGATAVEMALRIRPQVALVDIGLPEMDGYEVAHRIRAGLGASIRLVALTGYGQADDRRRALGAGFDEHLVKPASTDAVLTALRGPQNDGAG